jgi:hypothetical protein
VRIASGIIVNIDACKRHFPLNDFDYVVHEAGDFCVRMRCAGPHPVVVLLLRQRAQVSFCGFDIAGGFNSPVHRNLKVGEGDKNLLR